MYESALRGEVSQGDIFDNLPTVYIQQTNDGFEAKIDYRRVVLLSHDCDYDKPKSPLVLVAPVRELSSLSSDAQHNIRSGRTINAMYLTAHDPLLPESYIDLRAISTLEKTIIRDANIQGQRLISLDDDARLALQKRIALFVGVDR